jgi:hypothetical protein
MKIVPVVAVGTYYKYKSPAAGPNAGSMQGLVWHAKQNRSPPLADKWQLHHPRHPAGTPVAVGNGPQAYAYAANVLHAVAAVAWLNPGSLPVALIPVPASNTTRATMQTGRWPARELANELAQRGVGRVCLALAQKVGTESQKGARGKMLPLLENLEVVALPHASEFVVYVDDVITYGEHVAAVDRVLRPTGVSGAVVIGITHSVTRDAYEVVYATVEYDSENIGWSVSTRLL